MGSGRARVRWTALAVSAGLLALAAATGWLLARGTRGAEIATVWALPVAVIALVVTVYSLRRENAAPHAGHAGPQQFRQDVQAMLVLLDQDARTGRLPPYLPQGADVSQLARTVRARRGVRSGMRSQDPAEAAATRAYQLPVERADTSEPATPWPSVASRYSRLVVLADPGLGKSWLIRTETHRLCGEAQAAASEDAPLIPVPVRCDQLVAAQGRTLAEAATGYLIAQRLLEPRSATQLRSQIEAGGIVLLLDALDELTNDEDYGRLKELLRTWTVQAGERARCVITSRIAGYRGTPLPDAREVELQAFTASDVTAAVQAWKLPAPVSARVLSAVRDPAVAGMARVPLLLALLCSLAGELREGEQLPDTRGQLYERVLRWFLTRVHRAEDNPGRPELAAEEIDGLLDIVGPVAFQFATQAGGWADLMPADQLRNAVRLTGAFTELGRTAGDIVKDLSVSAGILVPTGNPSAGRRSSYLFLHRTIAEYLVARHLASLPAAAWIEAVDRHLWFDPDWAEVIPLLGSQLDSAAAGRLVLYLLGQREDPFHHGLLTALRVLAERPGPENVLPAGAAPRIVDAILNAMELTPADSLTLSALEAVPRLPRQIADELASRLTDQEPAVRRRAVELLARRHQPGITAQLLARLRDRDPRVRQAIAEALGSRMNEAGAVSGLGTCMADRDLAVRWTAAVILEGSHRAAVLPELLPCLEHDDPNVRVAAVWALGHHYVASAADELLERLEDRDPDVRVAAVQALAPVMRQAVTEGLLGRLRDPSTAVRIAAVEALSRRDAPEVTSALVDRLKDRHYAVRLAAVHAAALRHGAEVTDELLARLDDPSPDVGSAAANALGRRGTRPAVSRASGAVRGTAASPASADAPEDPDLSVRVATVRALSRRTEPEVTAGLLESLRAPHAALRKVAADALADRTGPAVDRGLLTCLSDWDPLVRVAAIKALSAPGHEAASELVTLVSGQDADLREAAVRVLGHRDGETVTKVLLACLDDQDGDVRLAAVGALAKRNAPGVTGALLGCLDSPDPAVRMRSLRALSARPGPEVTHGLLARISHRDDALRAELIAALGARRERAALKHLIGCMSDPDGAIARTAARAVVAQATADDLLTLSTQVRSCDPATRRLIYPDMARLAGNFYLLLPVAARDRVRSELAWLTGSLRLCTATRRGHGFACCGSEPG